MEFDNKHGGLPPINSVHNRRKSYKWLYIAAILLLILSNVFSYFYFRDKDDEHNQNSYAKSNSTDANMPDLKHHNKEISSYYNTALAKLDELSLSNFALQQQLKDKNSEIFQLKENIEDILSDSKATQLDLLKAETMVKDLEVKVNFYSSQIEKYKKDNDLMNSELKNLKEKNIELANKNEYLHNKLGDIQFFSVNNIKIVPIELKRGRNETVTSKARRVDIFRVMFDIIDNRIMDAGTYEFIVRIIDPEGELIFNTSSGSGYFAKRNSQEEIQYTKSRKIHFSEAAVYYGINIDWEQSNDFLKGEYTIELYNNGYLIGKAVRVLK